MILARMKYDDTGRTFKVKCRLIQVLWQLLKLNTKWHRRQWLRTRSLLAKILFRKCKSPKTFWIICIRVNTAKTRLVWLFCPMHSSNSCWLSFICKVFMMGRNMRNKEQQARSAMSIKHISLHRSDYQRTTIKRQTHVIKNTQITIISVIIQSHQLVN